MDKRLSLGAVFVVAVAAACTQEPPGTLIVSGGGTGPDLASAKGYFKNETWPKVFQKSCQPCHADLAQPLGDGTGENGAPVYLGTIADDAESAYEAIDAYESPYGSALLAIPDNSELLLHGKHTGPALTDMQADSVRAWLALEASERHLYGGGTGAGDPGTTTGQGAGGSEPDPPAQTVTEALEQWSGCMDEGEWIETGMSLLYSQQTVGNGPCVGCHNAGNGGAYLDDNESDTFQMNRQLPYVLRMVIGKVDGNGQFSDLVASNRFKNKGAEVCTNMATCHPKYALPPNVSSAVDQFFQKTYARWKASGGNCDRSGAGGAGGGGGAGGAGGGP